MFDSVWIGLFLSGAVKIGYRYEINRNPVKFDRVLLFGSSNGTIFDADYKLLLLH